MALRKAKTNLQPEQAHEIGRQIATNTQKPIEKNKKICKNATYAKYQ